MTIESEAQAVRRELVVLALDPSLRATGWAHSDGQSGVLSTPRAVGSGVERLAWIRDGVLDLAAGADLVLIEGYSFASRGRAVVSLGELGGVLRLALHEAGLVVVEVAPAVRCRYATGKGNAPKEAVLAAAIRRLGYAGHKHDEADALWLLALARDRYDLPGRVDVPQAHRTALEGVAWPACA